MAGGPPISASQTMEGVRSEAGPVVVARPARRGAMPEWLLFLLFVGPNLILFSIFSFWPMIYSAYLSLTSWDMISPVKQFVGLDNYRFLYHDPQFHTVLLNTLYFTVGAVGGTLILGLLVALLLNQPLRGRDGARAVIFAPTLLSAAAIAIVWAYMFDPRFGLLAQVLAWVHVPSPSWLTTTQW